MLTSPALDSLARQLAGVLASFNLPATMFGHPEVVRKAADAAAEVFQGYAKARPSKADAYAAALAFLRGQSLDERQRDLVAGTLSERIREQGNACALGHRDFSKLLDMYGCEAEAGELWRLTWFGLLGSYLSFNPVKASDAEKAGWTALRSFLLRTWPVIDRQSGTKVVPDWVSVLRSDPDLVGDKAAQRYALDYLRGDETMVKKLSEDLAIPESSWFWHALVLSAVRRCAEQNDDRFKESLPRLLMLIGARPVYRDEALELLLMRYHRCSDTSVHAHLRDYVCRKDVWRNPKLRAAGLATAWNRVGDDVWRMVLQWVNKANLRDFFEVLAARRQADEGRLEFWSQYMEQISWTRLIFSSQTRTLAWHNEGIRNLIAREEDAYATMSANADVDAFMMQLGDHLVVEFSKVPNAAYIYKADELPFEPYSREYTGTTGDLKHGYRHRCAARLMHMHGWQATARYELQKLGIYPDQPVATTVRRAMPAGEDTQTQSQEPSTRQRTSQSGAGDVPTSAAFDMDSLERLVAEFSRARIVDKRNGKGGRLWVEDPMQHTRLERSLKQWGFRWAEATSAYYLPDR